MDDLKLAIRSLRRRPGYSLLVAGMLALSIAGTTAIFSLVHSLLLAPLPFAEPERLVYLDETAPDWHLDLVSISYADFHAWRQENRGFESMALHRSASYNLTVGDTVERIEAARVTHDLMRVLGVRPARGRGFTAEDDAPGAPRAVILGDALGRRLFPQAEALGSTLRLDAELYEVVGVLPPRLRFPPEALLWVPAGGDPERDFGSYSYEGVGRLRPDVTPVEAAADLDRTLEPLIEKYPFKQAVSSVVRPLQEHFVADSRRTAWTLLGAVILVLLVACSNVAALMLAVGASRQREIAVCLALGARRTTLVRQALVESLVLAALGGAGGIAAGGWALRTLGAPLVGELPFWVDLSPSGTALIVCFAAGLVTTLLFGLWPAVATSSISLAGVLHTTGDRSSESRGRRRALSGLVAAEMALAQALLVGAGLVALSQQRLLEADPGFRPEGVLRFRVSLPESRYPEVQGRVDLFRELRRRLEAIPGVLSAAAISNPPLDGHEGNFFESEDSQEGADSEAARPVTLTRHATEGYLETMGVPLRQGRDLTPAAGDEGSRAEVVVNETFAELYWPDRDPIGRRIRAGDHSWLTVVGVAGDVHHYGVGEEVRPGIYLPLPLSVPGSMAFVVRTGVEPLSSIEAVRDVVRQLDPELPLHRVTTMEAELARSLALRRTTATLFALFAGVALVLAAGGAFGVVSYSVGRRRREIGVRMALGARQGQILKLLLSQGCAVAGLGVASGLAVSVLLGRSLESLLFGVDTLDPRVLLAVSAVLLATAALANLLPAWRAARLSPVRALRTD